MADRRSIHIDGLSHLTAIPVASRIGPLVMSSIIAPFDPGTRDVPDTIDEQVSNIFTHVASMLDAVRRDVGRHHQDELLGRRPRRTDRRSKHPWLEHFPDEALPPRPPHPGQQRRAGGLADFTAYVT